MSPREGSGCFGGSRRIPAAAPISACPVRFYMVGSAAMKQYVIDELKPKEQAALEAYLERHVQSSGVDGLYWLPIDDHLLSPDQQAHVDCKPFAFALELLPDRLVCELLVRTRSRMRCSCIAYASPGQRDWLMNTVDAILDRLGVQA
jgi:hypothetical protein